MINESTPEQEKYFQAYIIEASDNEIHEITNFLLEKHQKGKIKLIFRKTSRTYLRIVNADELKQAATFYSTP